MSNISKSVKNQMFEKLEKYLDKLENKIFLLTIFVLSIILVGNTQKWDTNIFTNIALMLIGALIGAYTKKEGIKND